MEPGLTPAPLGAGACGRGAMSLMQSSPGCCRPCRIGVSVVKKKGVLACGLHVWLLLGGAQHGAVAWFMLRCDQRRRLSDGPLRGAAVLRVGAWRLALWQWPIVCGFDHGCGPWHVALVCWRPLVRVTRSRLGVAPHVVWRRMVRVSLRLRLVLFRCVRSSPRALGCVSFSLHVVLVSRSSSGWTREIVVLRFAE